MNTEVASRDYQPKVSPQAWNAFTSLARSLGFIITQPGAYEGKPSPAAMLDALAAAYRRDPAGVKLALKVLGVTPDGVPSFTHPEPE